MTFDFEGARKAGASDDQIIEHLSSHPDYSGFDFASAKKAGAPSKEMIEYLKTEYKPREGKEKKNKAIELPTSAPSQTEVFSAIALLGMGSAVRGVAQWAQEKVEANTPPTMSELVTGKKGPTWLEKSLPEPYKKTNIEKMLAEKKKLSNDPKYKTSAMAGEVVGDIAEPISLALPMGKAKTVWGLAKAGALAGIVTGGIKEKTADESRTSNAVWGGISGTAGGAAFGVAGKYLGKALGKDWFNGDKELSKDVIDYLYKEHGKEVADAALAMFTPAARAAALNPKLVEAQKKSLDSFHEDHAHKHGWTVDDYIQNPDEHSWRDSLNFAANKFANANVPKGLDKDVKEAFHRSLKDDFKAKAEDAARPRTQEEVDALAIQAAKDSHLKEQHEAVTHATEREATVRKVLEENERDAKIADAKVSSSGRKAEQEALSKDRIQKYEEEVKASKEREAHLAKVQADIARSAAIAERKVSAQDRRYQQEVGAKSRVAAAEEGAKSEAEFAPHVEAVKAENERAARVAARSESAHSNRQPTSMETAHTEAFAENKELANVAKELADTKASALRGGGSPTPSKTKVVGKGEKAGVTTADLAGRAKGQAAKTVSGATLGASSAAMADDGEGGSDDYGMNMAQGAVLGAAGVYGASKLAKNVGTRFFDKAKASTAAEIGVDVLKKLDYAYGQISTRLHNISHSIGFKASELDGKMLIDTHNGIAKADPFFEAVHNLGPKSKEAVKVAWLNGNREGLKAAFSNHPEALKSLEETFKHIDTIGKELKDKGIIEGLGDNYLPRSVKDREGLLQSLGFKHRVILEDQLEKAARKVDGKLSDGEEAEIINSFLKGKKGDVFSPSFSKGRVIEDVSSEMAKFYHDPIETFHSYINNTTQEKHLHDFFGKSAKVVDGKLDVKGSIGQHVQELLKKGEIDHGQADELRNLFDARYRAGRALASPAAQVYTQAATVLALGNMVSSSKNLGDPITAAFRYGFVPAIKSTLKTLSGRSELTPKDLGLVDHISADFINTTPTARLTNNVMNASGWKLLDSFGKSVQFGASLNKARDLARTSEGFSELKRKYSSALGDRFPQYVKDLREGELSPLVKSVAFWEVAQHQPLTRLQKSEAQLRNPSLAAFTHQFKSFMMSQANWVRMDAYNEIKKGDHASVVRGATNLAKISTALGLAGLTGVEIGDFLTGRKSDVGTSDFAVNAFNQVGINEDAVRKFKAKDYEGAMADYAIPSTGPLDLAGAAWRVGTGMNVDKGKAGAKERAKDNITLMRALPIVGPTVAALSPEGQRRERMRMRNKMKQDAKDRQ